LKFIRNFICFKIITASMWLRNSIVAISPVLKSLRCSVVATFPCISHDALLQLCWCQFEVLFLQADSGGPLMVGDDDRVTVVGVISTGIGCARPKLPGLYTRLSSYSTWIRAHVQAPWRRLNTWILWQHTLQSTAGFKVWNVMSLPEWSKEWSDSADFKHDANLPGSIAMIYQLVNSYYNWRRSNDFRRSLLVTLRKQHELRFIYHTFARKIDTI
jgi:hypothetical protein